MKNLVKVFYVVFLLTLLLGTVAYAGCNAGVCSLTLEQGNWIPYVDDAATGKITSSTCTGEGYNNYLWVKTWMSYYNQNGQYAEKSAYDYEFRTSSLSVRVEGTTDNGIAAEGLFTAECYRCGDGFSSKKIRKSF